MYDLHCLGIRGVTIRMTQTQQKYQHFYCFFYRINTCRNVDVSAAKPIIKNSKLRGVWKIVDYNEIEKGVRQGFDDDWGSSNPLYC